MVGGNWLNNQKVLGKGEPVQKELFRVESVIPGGGRKGAWSLKGTHECNKS